uniref:Zn(2)-C6 fungal-type domain-containing protein n=1 Tax=Kwoniella bestiolae CBS 10118 TaxID=1296100 RepID=A0A1B9G1J2_9TREE|nr:hypothetical protein I302_06339 [Kwoniella bestiolae CBS 10118]OCF24878.1 hypothetical protein I302_06339 [Kwoniella bestiolae CBS 10118]
MTPIIRPILRSITLGYIPSSPLDTATTPYETQLPAIARQPALRIPQQEPYRRLYVITPLEATSEIASMTGDTDEEDTLRKRSRSSTACDQCRSRKVACDARTPCQRCTTEGRECVYGSKVQKTPLTRARMTELELRLEVHEKLWSTTASKVSLQQAEDMIKKNGLEKTLATLKLEQNGANMPLDEMTMIPASVKPPTMDQMDPSVYNDSVLSHIPRPPMSSYNDPNLSRTHDDDIPRTRATSPLTFLPLKSAYHLYQHDEPYVDDYSWQEGASTGEGDRGVLDGMGGEPASILHRGSSFVGLSASATFLHAIEQLVSRRRDTNGSSVGSLFPLAGPSTGSSHRGFASPFGNSLIDGRHKQVKDQADPRRMVVPRWADVKGLVDSYFRYFHHMSPLVHEPTIRAQLTGALPIPSGAGSTILLNMIFALGEYDKAEASDSPQGEVYYRRARDALQTSWLEEGNLELIQGLAIMAIYLQQTNHPNAGYLCLGSAIRMAIALGLHMPPAPTRTRTSSDASTQSLAFRKELRVRVWWSIVGLEIGCAITLGRPSAVAHAELASCVFPINCDDESFTVSSLDPPTDSPHPTVYSALNVQCHLAKAVCQVYDRILHCDRPPTIEQIRWCDKRIVEAFETVPQSIRGQPTLGPNRLALAVQMWRMRDHRAILYRPVMLAAAFASWQYRIFDPNVEECVEACRRLSIDNLNDISHFVHTEPQPRQRGAEWYILYFGFQSALTLVLSIIWEPHDRSAPVWRETLDMSIRLFRSLRSMQPMATLIGSKI